MCAVCGVHFLCLWMGFLSVRLSLFLSHEPGATGECWECKSAMSDGDSLPGKQCSGGRWEKGGRCLAFTLQILYQPLISTVTPQEERFLPMDHRSF